MGRGGMMIDTTTLESKIASYLETCKRSGRNPTYKGVGIALGVSGRTIANVVQGRFNGHCYTDKPHVTRCIQNGDFGTVQGVFRGEV